MRKPHLALALLVCGLAACDDPLLGKPSSDADDAAMTQEVTPAEGGVAPETAAPEASPEVTPDAPAEATPAAEAVADTTPPAPDVAPDSAVLAEAGPELGAADALVEPDVEDNGAPEATPADAPGASDAGQADATPGTCDEPTLPATAASGWKQWDTGLKLLTAGKANHRGEDLIVGEGDAQTLAATFAYGALLGEVELEAEDVEIFVQPAPPCGAWAQLGTATTTSNDWLGAGGGQVGFEVPPASQLPVGFYPVVLRVVGDGTTLRLHLAVVAPGTSVVTFDIDGTLTTSDLELVTEVIVGIFNGTYQEQVYPGAASVVQAWADRGYLVQYLTARPTTLRATSFEWLVSEGFPPGVLRFTPDGQNVLDAAGVKTAYLTELASNAEVSLYAGYGNATSDIEAYAQAGIPKERTWIIGPNAGAESTVPVTDYPSHLPTAQAQAVASPAGPTAYTW